MHQMSQCCCFASGMSLLIQVAGELKMIAKDFNIAVLVYTSLFPVTTKTKLELLLNFKIVGPSLEKSKLFFVNDDKIKVGIK